VEGLLHANLGFAGEESAGSSFLRRNGAVWTTDKDGIIAALLAAEITASLKKDPGEVFREITKDLGDSIYDRIDAPATSKQKLALEKMTKENIHFSDLAGEKILSVLSKAPGDGEPIGGIKVIAENGWFAARPSGTEDIYKIYAESFSGKSHLEQIETAAKTIVGKAFV
jgi:phosphoglucomutase